MVKPMMNPIKNLAGQLKLPNLQDLLKEKIISTFIC